MKTIKYSIIFLIGFLTSFSTVHSQDSINAEQALTDFDILNSALTTYHPDLYLYTSQDKMDSIRSYVKNNIKTSMATMDFYRLIFPLVSKIKNKHTNLVIPKSIKSRISVESKRIPFSFIIRRDSLFVFQNLSQEPKIKAGDVITKINGLDAADIINEMLDFQTSDGFNLSLPLYDVGRNFIKNYAIVYGTPDYFDIQYLSQDGNLKNVKINALKRSEFSKAPSTEKASESFDFFIKDKIGFLTIRTFEIMKMKNYRKFLKKSFEEIKKKELKHLIIDLRENSGGFPEASDEILSYLINKKIFPLKSQYALIDKLPENNLFVQDEAFKYFHKEKFQKIGSKHHVKNISSHSISPKKLSFDGKLVMLIDERCASTTSSMLGQVQNHLDNVKFVGNETGGNPVTVVANYTVKMILPNSKIELLLPLIKSEKNVNFSNSGRGIIPDYIIQPSVNDYLNKNDVVLKKGIEIVLQ